MDHLIGYWIFISSKSDLLQLMHISKLSSIINAHALITLPSYPEIKITDWDYADE